MIIVNPEIAGLDISTGHAVDSFFSTNAPFDPWAPICLSIFIDTVINHKSILFPLPSTAAVKKLDDPLLPLIFVEGKKFGLIEAKTDASADQIQLSAKQLEKEYKLFVKWARENAVLLAGWMKFHREAPRIARSHALHVPKHIIDDFWDKKQTEELSRQTGIVEPDLNYAFDVFARSIMYHKILGEDIPYFAHPVRDRAFDYLPVIAQYQERWSWGQYFVQMYNRDNSYRDITWLLEKLSSIQETTFKYNSTWYNPNNQSPNLQIDLLSSIASDSGLPAKLKNDIHKMLKIGLSVGTALLSIPLPVASIILGLGAVAVESWSGNVSGNLGKMKVFKGHLEWPGLLGKQYQSITKK
jgi:hypothetical protein